MGELLAEKRDMPPSVRAASALTLFLAVYAAATAGPGCIVGLFVGPHILIPALVCAVLAPVLLLSRRGLVHQRRWARWLLIVLSAAAALALTIAIVRALTGKEIDFPMAIPWLLIALCFALIALTLSGSSANIWCTK